MNNIPNHPNLLTYIEVMVIDRDLALAYPVEIPAAININ